MARYSVFLQGFGQIILTTFIRAHPYWAWRILKGRDFFFVYILPLLLIDFFFLKKKLFLFINIITIATCAYWPARPFWNEPVRAIDSTRVPYKSIYTSYRYKILERYKIHIWSDRYTTLSKIKTQSLHFLMCMPSTIYLYNRVN